MTIGAAGGGAGGVGVGVGVDRRGWVVVQVYFRMSSESV